MKTQDVLRDLQRSIIECQNCPELRAYAEQVGQQKRKAYAGMDYWARPVPAFGDATASVALVGLAPGAHGSNRTGRMFTGDASGTWLYRALFKAGFANQEAQSDKNDGLRLRDAFITSAIRCAPPHNRPTPAQIKRCAPYLENELALLRRLRVVIGLGAIGTQAAVDALHELGYRFRDKPKFRHGGEFICTKPRSQRNIVLLASYHPSRQNTNTGVLTEQMLDEIFCRARAVLTSE